MFRAVVFLLLIVAVTINAAPNCGENQVFTPCGTKCPTTCQDQQPKACTLACIPGCECVEGYVRNADNQCVLLQNC
ncbi:chymotrypsin inhibitor [Solenopsis invicta]|uniref:chymotrypsin inhibitor n=1 Tax=Solenopsis invicta TaxID=13686 RepID=UPI0001FECCA6|nr:chymotrypsin inhibitor [Solenopsis invicta]